jgi:hypothetical protein
MISQVSAKSVDYTVTFGAIARTVEYHDPHEDFRFTFDITAPKSVVLEHRSSSTPRSERYTIAFERTKQCLESLGYHVEVYGK